MNDLYLPVKQVPTLQEVLEDIGPLPPEAVFMGVSDDGLPVLFNVLDNNISNILIWKGELDILKVIAEYIVITQKGDRRHTDVEFLVITSKPKEWEFLINKSNHIKNTPCIGVVPMWTTEAEDLLLSLASWSSSNVTSKRSVLVLVDDMVKAVNEMNYDAILSLKYIMMNGAKRRVFIMGLMKSYLPGEIFVPKLSYENGIYSFLEGERLVNSWVPKTEI
jgi:hypothetical protein